MPYFEKSMYINVLELSVRLEKDPVVHDQGYVSLWCHVLGYFDKATRKEKNGYKIGITVFGKAASFAKTLSKGDTAVFFGRLQGRYNKEKNASEFNMVADKCILHSRTKGYDEQQDDAGVPDDAQRQQDAAEARSNDEPENFDDGEVLY